MTKTKQKYRLRQFFLTKRKFSVLNFLAQVLVPPNPKFLSLPLQSKNFHLRRTFIKYNISIVFFFKKKKVSPIKLRHRIKNACSAPSLFIIKYYYTILYYIRKTKLFTFDNKPLRRGQAKNLDTHMTTGTTCKLPKILDKSLMPKTTKKIEPPYV